MLTFDRKGRIAVIAVSEEGVRVGQRLCAHLPGSELFTSKSFSIPSQVYTGTLKDFAGSLWESHAAIIFVMASGIAVRSVAPWVESKLSDPAVVVVDDAARFAVSLLSGHEGHANRLTEIASEILRCTPVVTTGTESQKRVIVGVGCRKGVSQETILKCIDDALASAEKSRSDVYALATIDLKSNEPGIVEAARELGVPVRVIPRSRIRFLQNSLSSSHTTSFVEENIGVAAVCEPAALLASHQNSLILPKQAHNGVTIALTEDTCGVWE
jgi:cobalt-precorrin 5A hydrolase